ncbi:uncharacterized protein LOC128558389 [Mercenaria mercenaria]|uniref:uncharacterized protein LOC128558389 n=1 Tax=Mercenaria mercenaria TaxID=6596 RepID=UPI00234F5E1E|nr:uncharacterized protein LOC128558389 [Mercenaria mercenaria]
MDIGNFLERVRVVMGSINRSLEVSQSQDALDSAIVRLDALIRNVNRMTVAYPGCANILTDLSEALEVVQELKRSAEDDSQTRPEVQHGETGRPRYVVSRDQLELLLDLHFTNKEIADLVNISVSSVKRRLRQYNLSRKDRFCNMSNDELDERVKNITEGNPMLGQRNVMGQLLADGIHVQRDRVAEALLRVDPAAVAMRWSQTICRRTYSVPGPNALWHIDGNHKLIRYVSNE